MDICKEIISETYIHISSMYFHPCSVLFCAEICGQLFSAFSYTKGMNTL